MQKLAILVGLFVTVACCIVPAQETVAMHANIPFDFRMGNKVVPAGTYLIQATGGAITLRQEGGHIVTASFLTHAESRVTLINHGELVFHRYGDDYFLASVWTPFSNQGRVLPETKSEQQEAR